MLTAKVKSGTARRQRGKNTVDAVLEAAKNLFLAEGFTGLSLRRVASEANISLGNLTYYFSNKSDMFESMIDKVVGEYIESTEAAYEKFGDDAGANIALYLDYLFADSSDVNTQKFFYQFWAASAKGEMISNARKRVYESYYQNLEHVCREANPTLSEEALTNRLLLVMSLVEGLIVLLGNSGLDINSESLKNEYKHQALNIICSDC